MIASMIGGRYDGIEVRTFPDQPEIGVREMVILNPGDVMLRHLRDDRPLKSRIHLYRKGTNLKFYFDRIIHEYMDSPFNQV